jgi:transposase
MTARRLFNRPKDSVAHVDFLRHTGVITTSFEETDEKILIEAEVSELIAVCPHCGKDGTLGGNGTETQYFWEMPQGTKPCWVTFTKQLYLCRSCGKQSGRNLLFLPPPKSQISPRLLDHIYDLMDDGVNYTTISRWTGPDDSTIRVIRDKRDAARASSRAIRPTSGFLGLDDWQHGRRRKMRGILTDVVYRLPITLFERITIKKLKEYLGKYLADHPEVRVVVIDMSKTFRNFLQKHFPHIIIVADHFHIKQALEKRITRICNELAVPVIAAAEVCVSQQMNLFGEEIAGQPAKGRKAKNKKNSRVATELKKYRKVFMKKPEDKDERDRKQIKAWSGTYPLLAEILDRRDALYRIWDTAASAMDAKRQFVAWLRSLSPDATKKFASFIQMVLSWRKEIAVYFDFPEHPTNAFTESMVREVKHWNDAGRWVSFEVLRARFESYVPKNKKYPKPERKSPTVSKRPGVRRAKIPSRSLLRRRQGHG